MTHSFDALSMSRTFNLLSVVSNRKLSNIEFFLDGRLIYDIGLEFCQNDYQIAMWSSYLGQKRWIQENNGIPLFLAALNDFKDAA
jgi:hypothetical protein